MAIIGTIRLLKEDKSNLLNASLMFIQYEKNNLIEDIAKIHLLSAEQKFISASTSNAIDVEIRIGIGHLQHAFNSYQVLLERGTKKLFFFKAEWGEIKKTSILLKLASIACIIALIYEKIDDKNNYLGWKVTTKYYAEEYKVKRSNAISYWENAENHSYSGQYGFPRTTRPDKEKRKQYKDEVTFIDLFSKVIKEEI